MELNLAKYVNENKVFFKYNYSKRKTKDNVDALLNGVGMLVTEDTELLNIFFALVWYDTS